MFTLCTYHTIVIHHSATLHMILNSSQIYFNKYDEDLCMYSSDYKTCCINNCNVHNICMNRCLYRIHTQSTHCPIIHYVVYILTTIHPALRRLNK